MLRKVITTSSLAQHSFSFENHQNAMEMQALDSHDLARFLQQFSKTDVEQGMWSTNQQESAKMIENW